MKKWICLVMAAMLAAAALIGCTTNGSAKKELPQTISQDEWADAKKFVELSTGIKMAYIEMGDPEGPAVVLQHGMSDNSRSWSLAAPYFVEAGYHVYLPDLRGMGKSDAPDGYYTAVTYAADMEAFFDAMKIDKAVVIGHSLGSFTVQTFALMFPERCEKMVLVSSAPLKQNMSDSLTYLYQNYVEPLGEDEHPSDAFMDLWYACTFKEDNAEEVEFDKCLAGLKAEAKALSKSTWRNIIFGIAVTNLESAYSEFNTDIPVLLLHGNDDTMAKLEYQAELCELLNIDDNSYINYEGVGHNIQFEIPDQSSKDILRWLETGSL